MGKMVAKIAKGGVLLLVLISYALSGRAVVPDGAWSLSGDLTDTLNTLPGYHFTNHLSVTGEYSNHKFLVDIQPVKTQDEIAEYVGWDGDLLRLIQRFPEYPGKGLPRDKSIAYVEPDVFSHCATIPTTGLLLALADAESLAYLRNPKEAFIIGGRRIFPEERNQYQITTSALTSEIEAITPGFLVTGQGEDPIDAFPKGFKRWAFSSSITNSGSSNEGQLMTFKLDCFFPNKTNLFRSRTIRGSIRLERKADARAEFLPEISEPSLQVLDMSSRRYLFEQNQGASDYSYPYVLKNKKWDFDQNIVKNEASAVKTAIIAKGLPAEIKRLSQPMYLPSKNRRALIGLFMAVIFIAFPALFWFKSRAGVRSKQTKGS